ncbi:MAG: hypothetical protein IPG07_04670 [Crocinitomicaceae bacterium]|nr:hypothetical protein [Crocinitomicaceae bacterium]
MMRNLVIGICFMLLTGMSFGQGFKMHYSSSFADCFGALEVFDYTTESQIQFPVIMVSVMILSTCIRIFMR